MRTARRWALWALLLASLFARIDAVNDSRTSSDNYDGAVVESAKPDKNIRLGYYIDHIMMKEWYLISKGGSSPIYPYMLFPFGNFIGSAPVSRFCVSGSPQLHIEYSSGVQYPSIRIDVVKGSWSASSLTWNNQPPLNDNSTSLTNPPVSSGNYYTLTANMVNTAVRINVNAPFRIVHLSSDQTEWDIGNVDGNPQIHFDYSICDPNATCNIDTGVCTCNAGYEGTGTYCSKPPTPPPSLICPAIVISNANFSETVGDQTVTGTCLPTYGAVIPPTASCNNGAWGNVDNTCVKLSCPADNSGNFGYATYPATNAGTTVYGVCLNGYTGGTMRSCDDNGMWSTTYGACTRITCPVAIIGNANYGLTNSLTTVNGVCFSGYSGSPSATCSASGTWSVVSSCTQMVCNSVTEHNAVWPSTNVLSSSLGTCVDGYGGTPMRSCLANGVFNSTILYPCTRLQCSAETSSNSTWPTTDAGATASGTCLNGYSGSPTRSCLGNELWSTTVSAPCTRNVCPPQMFANATWVSTLSLSNGVGICVSGFSGNPTLPCLGSGAWSTTVTNPCIQLTCSAHQMDSATWPQVDAGTDVVHGTCVEGYSGSPTRSCSLTGQWGPIQTPCQRTRCAAIVEGNAVWSSADAFASVFGTCVEGYSGSPMRTCQSNGVFGTIINACVQRTCKATRLGQATWELTPANTPDVPGTCDIGWEGTVTRSCLSTGSWSGVFGSCTQIQCPPLDDASTRATWPQTLAGSNGVLGSCHANTDGSTSRDCFMNGTWSAPTGICINYPCPAVPNEGNAYWPSQAAGLVANGTCVFGFTSTGATRLCKSDGTWDPITNPCTNLICPAQSADHVTWPDAPTFWTVHGICDAGFQGTPVRECLATGVFGTVSGACNQIYCAAKTEARGVWNATAAGSTDVVGTCEPGWSGTISRDCGITGDWGTMEGTCQQIFCPYLNDSSALATWTQSVAGTTSVTGTCYNNTNGLPQRTCNFDGTWAPAVNPCSVNPCPQMQNDQNAFWPAATQPGSNVIGTCVTGYSSDAQPTRRCNENGQWDSVVTKPCMRNICHATEEGQADWSATDSLSYAYGACNAGYSGAPSRFCSADGVFGPILSSCVRLRCEATYADKAQWLSAFSGEANVVGTCDAGFSGAPTRNCTLDAAWSEPTGECSQIYCLPLHDVTARATWLTAKAGTATVFGICDFNSRTPSGAEPLRSCLISGAWSAPSEQCVTNPCAAINLEGKTSWPSTTAGNLAAGTCAAGYGFTLAPPTRQCFANGTWSSTISDDCTPLFCTTSAPSFQPFNATWTATQAGGTATGTCHPGFTSTSEPTRMCTLNAVWTDPSPRCTLVTCPSIADDGQYTAWPLTTGGATASGTCLYGYAGTPTRSCSAEGQWDTVTSSPCAQLVCPALVEGSAAWHSTTAGIVVSGTCVPGYQGVVVRVCTASGTWGSIVGQCNELRCAAETVAGITWPESSTGVTVNPECADGFEGSLSRTCQITGVWSAVEGECSRLKCTGGTYDQAVWPVANSLTTGVAGACVVGYTGNPTRDCDVDGIYSANVTNPCTRLYCAAENAGINGTWPSTASGNSTTSDCPAGTAGSLSRDCLLSGSWSAITGSCITLECPAESHADATWPQTHAGEVAAGACSLGYSGNPSRACDMQGDWGQISNGCVRNRCAGLEDGNALWPTSNSLSEEVQGICIERYFGYPVRSCDAMGNWGAMESECAPILCWGVVADNAVWKTTAAGDAAFGTCADGFVGWPYRLCGMNGVWNTTIVSPCTLRVNDCPAGSVGMTFFPQTPPGYANIGSCPSDFIQSPQGPPTRHCLSNGQWEEEFSNPCIVDPGSVSSGAASDFSLVSKTSSTVSLSWRAINRTDITRFRVDVATGTGSFVIANSGTAVDLTTESIVVQGLFPTTLYQFRLLVGKEDSYGATSSGLLSVTTSASPPGPLRIDSSAGGTVAISWTASAQAEYYLVYHQSTSTRDLSVVEGFTLSANISAAQGSATISGLEAGSYVILVLAGYRGEVEQVGSRITVTVANEQGSSEVVEEGSDSTGIIVAVVVVVIIAIAVTIAAFIYVQRRRNRKDLRKFISSASNDYQSPLEMEMSSPAHVTPGSSSMQLLNQPQTPRSPDTQYGIPAFLLIEYTQLRPGPPLPGSKSRKVASGALLDASLSAHIGVDVVAISTFMDDRSLSYAFNHDRFHREVALLWALNRHPNIVTLVAYTEQPRTVVLRLYDLDLAVHLQVQRQQNSALDTALLVHLARGIAAGMAAVHAFPAAHRGLKTANILLLDEGHVHPTPVITGFHVARVGEDSPATAAVGSTMRYASPEMFGHVHMMEGGWPLSHDMASDVYSYGVILWEMCTLKVPWEGMADVDIERHVIQAEFLPWREATKALASRGSANGQSTWAALPEVLKSIFVMSPNGRPTMAHICESI